MTALINFATSPLGISLLILPLAALVYFSVRWAWWQPTVSYDLPRILMYHMICDPQPGHKFRGLRVSPQAFEQQIKWLSEQGWTFVTMSELVAKPCPRKCVAVTFDDGFLDNYEHAFPILKKYGARATLYLVSDRHDRDWSVSKKTHHNTGELAREPKLSDDQIKEMLDSNVFELGGHTLSHCNLATTSAKDKRAEIIENRAAVQQQFSAELTSFAYPFGIFGDDDVELVREAGYATAVTTEEGIGTLEDPFRLKRVKVSGKEGFFSFKLRIRTGRRKR